MHPLLRHSVAAALGLLLSTAASPLSAQALPAAPSSQSPPKPASPPLNHTVVFLDPAHGGDDTGARLSAPTRETRSADQPLEKDVTLAIANRIRSQLSAFGLTVLLSREPAPPPSSVAPTSPAPVTSSPTPDQRAGLANHVHPFACIVLHATATGSGVHLITSALSSSADDASALLPWETAQADFLPQSTRLAGELASALGRAGLPIHASRASIRPLDNLTCPAVLLELAPLAQTSGQTSAPTSAADTGYQARVAQAVATALLFWRDHADHNIPAADAPGAQP